MKYRTAQGKTLDMAALASRYERTRAVGNMKVNARGDMIDGNNKIVKPATAKINEQYSKTVGNKSANVVKSNQVISKPMLTKAELELEQELLDDLEVEKIKENEIKGKK